jgi:hypothetical protein
LLGWWVVCVLGFVGGTRDDSLASRRWHLDRLHVMKCHSLLLATLVACGALPVRILPGSAVPSAWPRYLFLFRAVHGDFRLAEVRAAADTLGVSAESVCFEPATCDVPAVDYQPLIRSYGGDEGPDLFQWITLPDEHVAAAVAARCGLVRAAFDVWACTRVDAPKEALAPAEALARANVRWQTLADAVQCPADDASVSARRKMVASLGEGRSIHLMPGSKPRQPPASGAIDRRGCC